MTAEFDGGAARRPAADFREVIAPPPAQALRGERIVAWLRNRALHEGNGAGIAARALRRHDAAVARKGIEVRVVRQKRYG